MQTQSGSEVMLQSAVASLKRQLTEANKRIAQLSEEIAALELRQAERQSNILARREDDTLDNR